MVTTTKDHNHKKDQILLNSMIFHMLGKGIEDIQVNIKEYIENSYFVAEIDTLGIVTQADTFSELVYNIKEAIHLAYQ